MGVLTFAAASYLVRTAYQRLERRGVFRVDAAAASRPTAWIDGLRGIAALGVLSSHLSTELAPFTMQACCGAGSSSPSVFQLPPLRLLAAAPSWLALFFLLSGLSSSLGPLALARTDGRLDTSYASLGRSALKRPLRLMLPAAVATTLSWFAAQIGLYQPARVCGAMLLNTEYVQHSAGIGASIAELARSLYRTWTWLEPDNQYDHMQDVLSWMLQGSYLVYGVLLMTLGMRPRIRCAVVALLMLLSFQWSFKLVDPQLSVPYLAGVLLAELWQNERRRKKSQQTILTVLGPVLFVIAVVLMSWSKNQAEAVWWTRGVDWLIVQHAPRVHDPERLVGALGAIALTLSVLVTPRFQSALGSGLLLWLGRISFAVYLLHMTVLRIAMPWLICIDNPIKALVYLADVKSDGFKAATGTPGFIRKTLGAVVAVLLVLAAASLWARQLDPRIHSMISQIEQAVSGPDMQQLLRRQQQQQQQQNKQQAELSSSRRRQHTSSSDDDRSWVLPEYEHEHDYSHSHDHEQKV